MWVCRFHLSRPRSVLPGQQIHSSVFSGELYTPRATLGSGISIPIGLEETSDRLWIPKLPEEGEIHEEATSLLESLLKEQQKTLESLGKVLFLLGCSEFHLSSD